MNLPLPLRFLLPALALLAASLLAGCDQDTKIASLVPPVTAKTADPIPETGSPGKLLLGEAEWRARLSPEQFRVLRGAATERPFSCPLWKISDEPGVYHCAGCDLALFRSSDKFDSGTGWPSFTNPIAPNRVAEKRDLSHGMVRVETLCERCDGHLGHVFEDGPPPAGRRFCINGVALRFAPATPPKAAPNATTPPKAQP
jgi:peptide-methionine (R)-S-oxide reductase